MRTLGIDLAAEPPDTAACEITWLPNTAEGRVYMERLDDDRLLTLIEGADKVGVDCPFGWPAPFVNAVTAHANGEAYLREADLLPHLDQWLAGLFDPDRLDDTLDALQAASHGQGTAVEELHTAEQAIADRQRQLPQYRAALGAGADPTEVTHWINQATAAKAAAEAQLAGLRASIPTSLGRGDLRQVVTEARGLVHALGHADRPDGQRCTRSWESRGSSAGRTARGRDR